MESADCSSCTSMIADDLGLTQVVARLLYNRGHKTPKDARRFLLMETEFLGDPFLMKDVDLAIARIESAIKEGQTILVYGDYDVDGVTSVCTLLLYLRSKGADVLYYIPNRLGEGHGVSKEAIARFAKEGVGLIITVDTGVTAIEEVAYAKTVGVDFVITDHHECYGELPPAEAVVNPRRPDCPYPFKELAGVGVVFKLICAMEQHLTGHTMLTCVKDNASLYADLVCVGTIADVMPIVEENKLIVALGLQMIEYKPRLGIAELMDAASFRAEGGYAPAKKKHKVNSSYIGFTLAPRINAAGRIKSASIAVDLFLTDDRARAKQLASLLCDANRERQNEENYIMQEAFDMIDVSHDFENDPVIILESDYWHHGVIGIVASRITEKYGLPSLLISYDGNDPDAHLYSDIGKGSGRSVKGLNLVEALCTCEDFLIKFGGHELAAGLSIRRQDVPKFKERVNAYARERRGEIFAEQTIDVDSPIDLGEITMDVAKDLTRLEPYGTGNPAPVFGAFDLMIKEVTPVTGGKHTKLILGNDKISLTAMFFSCPTATLRFYPGDRVDVLFNIDINEYNGRRTVQMIVKDIRLSQNQLDSMQADADRFEQIWKGASFSKEEDVLPSRADFAAVYTFVRQCVRNGVDSISHRAILIRMRSIPSCHINYIKLKCIIRVLQEMNVLGIDEYSKEAYSFRLHFSDEKVDLEKSNILRRLRSQQL